jgi:hypothetical protein
MAVYTINISSSTTMRTSLVDALTAAGILTTNHYNASDDLIVTTTRSNKVLRFNFGTSRMTVYYGDAYSSGTTITNQVTVSSFGSLTAESCVAIITDKLFYIGERSTTSSFSGAVFGRVTSANQEYICIGWSSGIVSAVIKDTTNNQDAHVLSFVNAAISPSNNYYLVDTPVTGAGSLLLGNSIQGVKLLTRAPVTTQLNINYGDDASVIFTGTRGVTNYFGASILIENGVSWVPA